METRANHVLIGVFTLLGLAALVVLGLWAARFQAHADWQVFDIRFEQAVTGLSVGSMVQYNGINMGSVRELRLDPDDPRQVLARIRVDGSAPVREDTTARLSVSGLTGVALIQLRGGSPESARLEPGPDGSPPVITAEESPLQRLIDASEDIANTASEVMLRLLDFLSEDNAERLNATIANVDELTRTIAGEGDSMAEIIRNARESSERMAELIDKAGIAMDSASGSLQSIDEHLVAILPEVGRDISQAASEFASLAARLDSILADNEQALSEFGTESLAQFGPTMQELRLLIRELSRVSGRFERNPSRFLFGGDQLEEYQP
ncbi:MAG: MlaD family protein [Wenzhouxiangella sp.]